jgi:hypothetical protein
MDDHFVISEETDLKLSISTDTSVRIVLKIFILFYHKKIWIPKVNDEGNDVNDFKNENNITDTENERKSILLIKPIDKEAVSITYKKESLNLVDRSTPVKFLT